MGMFDDIKRLLWVKKAVAESAAEKAAQKGSELKDEWSEKASETWEKGKEIAEDLGEKITTKAKEARDHVADLWDKKDDWTQNEKKPMQDDNKNPNREGNPLDENKSSLGDQVEKTLDKAKEKGGELLDKAVKTSDKVWEKTEQVSEDLWNKAKAAAAKAGEKFEESIDSWLEKAKELDKKIEEEKDKVDANRDGWADKSLKDKMKEHESNLKNKDDFFERAARYADGDYSMGKPVVTRKPEGNEEDTEGGMTPLPPLPKKDDFADDAIIDDGDES